MRCRVEKLIINNTHNHLLLFHSSARSVHAAVSSSVPYTRRNRAHRPTTHSPIFRCTWFAFFHNMIRLSFWSRDLAVAWRVIIFYWILCMWRARASAPKSFLLLILMLRTFKEYQIMWIECWAVECEWVAKRTCDTQMQSATKRPKTQSTNKKIHSVTKSTRNYERVIAFVKTSEATKCERRRNEK